MSITGAMGLSLQGMTAQGTRVAAIASNTAKSGTTGYGRLDTTLSTAAPGATGGVTATVGQTAGQAASASDPDGDAQSDMTGLVEARTSFAASAKAFETGADMWDMLMSMKRD